MLVDLTRVRIARQLAVDLGAAAGLAAALADEAVYEATRRESAKAVAAALGVSEATVRKAVRLHNARRALTEGAEPDTGKRTSGAKGT